MQPGMQSTYIYIHQKLRLYGGKAKERSSSHMEKDRRSILIWEALKCVCIHSRDPSRYLCCCSPATRMESESLLYANENGYSTHQFDRKDGRGYIRGYIKGRPRVTERNKITDIYRKKKKRVKKKAKGDARIYKLRRRRKRAMSRKCRSFLLFLFGFDSSSSSSRSCVLLLLPGCRPHVCTVSDTVVLMAFFSFLMCFFFFFFRGVYIIAGPRESGIMLTA